MNLKTFLAFLFLTVASFLLSTVPHMASAAALLPLRSIECGDLIGGCGPGLCCSVWGYCGTGVEYCGAAPGADPANCGAGPPCPPDYCCSKWGYCGTDSEHCAPYGW